MRKMFLLSALAFAVAGCANHQGVPQVRDISEVRRHLNADGQYTVAQGDTLYGIAWQQGLDYRELAALNDIEPPYNIYPGQQLVLRSSGAEVDREVTQVSQSAPVDGEAGESSGAVATGIGETPVQVAANAQEVDWLLPDEPTSEETAQDDEAIGAQVEPEPEPTETESQVTQSDASERRQPDRPETQPETETQVSAPSTQQASVDRSERTYTPAENIEWQWPADGEVVGTFGEGGSITAGIDIAGQKGQSVKAAGPGIVVYAGSGVRGYGNLILIKHNDEYLSAYAHNDTLRVKENDVIEGGEVIATMGNSSAEEARLHFEIRKDGQPEDPLTYLPGR
ncbi:peptidoglycan DD-metalloendopeptidase family protein [Halomonas sp. TBZ9]|uniref:Peptidoglycan DD-metalloendopeptidase family protein n=1 Tax=Vreelandella azerica TaxID=2732867 RepID=A0A7Y3XB55_9GAMM|nr:peptidoglycan DD-metalloendopeptidase family protein [Halomonas azerica]NOG31978.1 peptidoglycan DD-metalloendopeptidase family protein [Halomonas azerica]